MSDRVASDSAKKGKAGFTLVELLMVVAILGLAAGAVVLAVPDPRPAVGAEAERFAARLTRARDEAVLSNRPVAVEITSTGYAFTVFDGREWSGLSDGPFGPETWQPATAVSPAEGARFVFDPTGVAEPGTLTLARDGKGKTVTVDGAGEVTLQ
ncbi:GspH/FimT family pseudopilin [Brevundimonas sp.]|uniref:GspH/FimT family pseudopilin n=1 Tax=Brevundimonas sp. TaxID=1871086 RepID=UPI002B829F9B|nr:GspH/FimT family pseudopilin [Brevundimonas sp.]HWQ87020.1 GspH/FimT family pseudopilin [Brevundimonas sp.]